MSATVLILRVLWLHVLWQNDEPSPQMTILARYLLQIGCKCPGLQEAWRILDFLSNYPESTHIVSALQPTVHTQSTSNRRGQHLCEHPAIFTRIGMKQCILHHKSHLFETVSTVPLFLHILRLSCSLHGFLIIMASPRAGGTWWALAQLFLRLKLCFGVEFLCTVHHDLVYD